MQGPGCPGVGKQAVAGSVYGKVCRETNKVVVLAGSPGLVV